MGQDAVRNESNPRHCGVLVAASSRLQRIIAFDDRVSDARDMMSGGYRTFTSDRGLLALTLAATLRRATGMSWQLTAITTTPNKTMESAVVTPVSLTEAVCLDSDPQPSGRYDSHMPQLGAGDLGCLHGMKARRMHDTGCFTTRMYSSGTGRLQNSSLR